MATPQILVNGEVDDHGNKSSTPPVTVTLREKKQRDSLVERQSSAERIRLSRVAFFQELYGENMSEGGSSPSNNGNCMRTAAGDDTPAESTTLNAEDTAISEKNRNQDYNKQMADIVIEEAEQEPCTIDEALEHVNELLKSSDITMEELAAKGCDRSKLSVQFTTPDNRRVSIDQIIKVQPQHKTGKKPVSQKLRSSFKRLKSLSKSKPKKAKHQSLFMHGHLHADDYIREQYDTIKHYDFMFENLAFEGGGAKMIGYVGAITVSTDLCTCMLYILWLMSA